MPNRTISFVSILSSEISKRSNAQGEEANLHQSFAMTDNTIDQLLVLIDKELTDYCTVGSLLSGSSADDETSQKANDLPFGLRIGAKRRRLEQPSDTESDENGVKWGLHLRWRSKMIQWQFKVIDHLNLDRDIVAIATNYLDRYCLEHPRPVEDLRTSQLLTLTCLYMAVKLFEFRIVLTRGAKSTMDTLLILTGSRFSIKEMESMEFKVLDTLKWKVHPPTEKVFMAHFTSVMPACESSMVEKLSTYVTELALLDPFFANYRKSETAFAALLYSRGKILDNQESPFSLKLSQSEHHDYDLQNPRIRLCYNRLSDLHRQNDEDFFKYERVASPVSVMQPLDR